MEQQVLLLGLVEAVAEVVLLQALVLVELVELRLEAAAEVNL
jgi:hypothetical protein